MVKVPLFVGYCFVRLSWGIDWPSPLQGMRGRLVREARYALLLLNFTFIQRAVAVEIDTENVAPAWSDHELG